MTSPYKEFKGSDVDRAIDLAVKDFGVEREKLRYDILSFGSSGVFGIVPARKAKIRVALPQEEEKPKKKRTTRKPKKNGKSVKASDPVVADVSDEISVLPEPELLLEREQEAQPASSEEEKKPFIDPLQLEKNKEMAKDALQRILDQISPEAELKIKESSKKITYLISGGDNAFLVGAKGKYIEAIRYLIEKILHRGIDEHRVRIEIDVDNYAKKKRQKLLQTTLALIEKCEETKENQSFGKLGGRERRMIHLLLKKYPNISTKSSGHGEKRTISLQYTTPAEPTIN